MTATLACTLCDRPGRLADSRDVARIPCNVRRFADQTFTLWRCAGCGSIHCREEVDLPAYYRYYPLQKQRLDFYEKLAFGRRLALLRRQGLRPDQTILDFGCGNGLFVEFLKAGGYARAEGYDKYVSAYAGPEPLAKRYDAVVSYDVIEHENDPRAALRSWSERLKPGGLLAVSTPNADGLSLKRIHDLNLHPPYHRHILSEKTLRSLAGPLGLRLRHASHRSFFDTLIPTVNARFIWAYNELADGVLDAITEPPRPGLVWSSPRLIFLAFFGYFLPRGDTMTLIWQKPAG